MGQERLSIREAVAFMPQGHQIIAEITEVLAALNR
jgi:hypothetical protein